MERKKSNALKTGHAVITGRTRLLVGVAALMAATVVIPYKSKAHTPGVNMDGPIGIHMALLGEPDGSQIAEEIEARMIEGEIGEALGGSVSDGAKQAARQAYAQNLFAPLWTRDAAIKLLKANPACRDNGFESGMTDEQLRNIIDARFSGDATDRAEGDLRLTATWLVLASKMSGGLSDEGGMVRSTEQKPTRSDLVTALRNAAQNDPIAEMEKFAALSPQYDLLKSALKQYRDYAQAGGWKKIREDNNWIEPGMDDPRVPALRERMRAEGFAPSWAFANIYRTTTDLAPTVYDELLVEQVKTFQKAHNLEQDGVLGPATLKAMNESVESKIRKIETAMNYWRSNPNPGDQHVWVNIPSYRVEGWKDGVREITMKTIVGKKRTETTAFSDEIEYIVANPKWFLPTGLFKRQKLRKLRKDPGYAARHNYTIYNRSTGDVLDPYSVDWNEPGVARTIQMVQDAGPNNALGELKIIFPNRHSIYLHDTPDDHLFENDVRALSSGCVRLEDSVAMANWLTDHDDVVATHVFNATLESGERDHFYLDKHVNVHLTYLPATVTPEGTIEFPADIYQKFNAPMLESDTYEDYLGVSDDEEPLLFVGRSGSTGSALSTENVTLR